MFSNLSFYLKIILSALAAFAVSFAMVPQVKKFAESVGAVDKPDARRINKVPVPRMGGIAIFCGFMLAMLLFAEKTQPVKGILIGCIIIAVMGGLDDLFNLPPIVKLCGQIFAAVICISCGVVMDGLTNLISTGDTVYIGGIVSVVLTGIWIVGCTNAVNLIDGLDGLAVGVSTISAATLFVISLSVAGGNVSVILACFIGACMGFWPYNRNPAKIFMGDVGSQLLGFVLSTVSVIGLFKLHALVTMLIPVLVMAVPLADTGFAIIRRLLKGQSPFHADKGHFHHRLLALGLTQRQAVTVLYSISIVLGIVAYFMVGETRRVKIACLVAAFIIVLGIVMYVMKIYPRKNAERSDPAVQEKGVKIYEKEKK